MMDCPPHKADNIKTNIERYNYTIPTKLTLAKWLEIQQMHKVDYFCLGPCGIMNFAFLKSINLKFYEGIIHEDHLFGMILFAHIKNAVISPRKLYKRRMRVGSTMTFKTDNKRKLPNFISDLYDYFSDVDEAWEYFRAYSWCVSAVEFTKFCESFDKNEICKQFKALFLKMMLIEASKVMNFKIDPYNIKIEFLALARRYKKYLPLHKKQFIYYDSPILWEIYNIYPFFRSIAKRLRDFILKG